MESRVSKLERMLEAADGQTHLAIEAMKVMHTRMSAMHLVLSDLAERERMGPADVERLMGVSGAADLSHGTALRRELLRLLRPRH